MKAKTDKAVTDVPLVRQAAGVVSLTFFDTLSFGEVVTKIKYLEKQFIKEFGKQTFLFDVQYAPGDESDYLEVYFERPERDNERRARLTRESQSDAVNRKKLAELTLRYGAPSEEELEAVKPKPKAKKLKKVAV